MADSKISALTEQSLGADDFVPIQRSTSNYRVNLMEAAVAAMRSLGSVYNIADPAYGAVNDGVTDNRAAIMAAHDAAEAAGGGVVWVPEGTWAVKPASGLCLLFNGDKVKLMGTGKTSILRFITAGSGDASVAANNFVGIAAKGSNDTATNYGASGLWVEDLRVECDTNVAGATSAVEARNAHGLIGLSHTPWSIIRGVTFGDICYHQIEINRSKNVWVENCDFGGNTESSRVQIDVAASGQNSDTPVNYLSEDVVFFNCRFAGRNTESQTLSVPRMIELDHSNLTFWRNIVFDSCEFGAVYSPSTNNYIGYIIAMDQTSTIFGEGLTITNCKFLGDSVGSTVGIRLVHTAGTIRGINISNNTFGSGYDCDGTRFAGGFKKCIEIGSGSGLTTLTGSSTVSTKYTDRTGIVIRDNVIMPRFVAGKSTSTTSAETVGIMVTATTDATIEGNFIKFPVSGGTFTAAVTDIITTTGSSSTDGMMVGDPLRFTTSGTLPAGLSLATTYYVRSVLSTTTFTVSATEGGAVVNITDTGSGTHTWANYLVNTTLTYSAAAAVAEVANLRFGNNTMIMQHDSVSVSTSLIYACIFNVKALEAASVYGFWEVTNNRLSEVGSGACVAGMVEYATSGAEVANPYIKGRWAGNIHDGSFTSQNLLQGHPSWLDDEHHLVLTADSSSITSTTVANVTGLSTRIHQSGRYKIHGEIIFTTPASTDGIKLAIDGPTGTTLALFWTIPTADTGEVTTLYTTTDAAVITTTARPASGTAWRATVDGYITTTAVGVVALQAASEVGSSTIIKAGSWLTIEAV